MKRLVTILLAVMWAVTAPAATMGDDGLHKADWMHDTFKDLREDLEEANAEGKRLLLLVEQRGCIYCSKMHEEVFPQEEVTKLLTEDYFVVQINMFGDTEITDFDGEALSEKDAIQKWGIMFTPTMIFLPEEVAEDATAEEAAVVTMPGAFGFHTTKNLLTWVLEKGYEGDENFQKYHARVFNAENQ